MSVLQHTSKFSTDIHLTLFNTNNSHSRTQINTQFNHDHHTEEAKISYFLQQYPVKVSPKHVIHSSSFKPGNYIVKSLPQLLLIILLNGLSINKMKTLKNELVSGTTAFISCFYIH
jgi:hypothetical protein